MTTSALCTFEGSVTQVRVVGAGRAVLLDPAVFEDGNTSWVQFVGALENAKLTDMRENLDPIHLNPRCAPFDATYTSGAEITVAVAQGGAEGGVVGKLPSGRDCSGVCRVVWAGEKKLVLERKNVQPAQVVGPIPEGDPETCVTADGGTAHRIGLDTIVLSGVKGGLLTCGERKTPIEGDWVFRQGPARNLTLDKLQVRGSILEARVTNESPPSPRDESWAPVAIVLGAVLLVGVIGLVSWLRRKAPRGKLSPALRKALHAAPADAVSYVDAPEQNAPMGKLSPALPEESHEVWTSTGTLNNNVRFELETALRDAFRTREKLDQMFRRGFARNLNEVVNEKKNIVDTVFLLLEDAEANRYTKKLVNTARSENKGNELLAKVARKMGVVDKSEF